MNISILCWILFLQSYVKAWQCTSPVGKSYSRKNSTVVLQFTVELTSIPITFDFKFYNSNISKARISYNSLNEIRTQALPGANITGDTAGNVVVTLNNVQLEDAGVYILISAGFAGCNCLYILGTPKKPTVSVSKTPSVGESVRLTCSSTSTTTPSNHSLSLKYDWKVNNSDNPGGNKYSYTSNRDKLTVNNIVKEDAYKQFTCTATEDARGGYTSVRSDQVSFDVYYGPDIIEFTPNDISYEKAENDSLNQVTCSASCHPGCNFTWTKGRDTEVSSTAVLNLGRLDSSKTGTYICTATRTGGQPKSKSLTVNVIYGPKNMFFNPSMEPYRLDENSNMAMITCSAECWECNYSWSGPNSFNSSDSSLNLGRITRAMAGTYTCTARNIKRSPHTTQRKQLSIEVRYGPDSIKVTNEQLVYTVDEDTTISSIKCEADCFPNCKYTWTKEGQSQPITSTGTLSLGQVQKLSAGNYICKATNGDTSSKWKEQTITINIRYGPYMSSTKLLPSTKNYTMNERQNINNISCSADCYPKCIYSWSKSRNGQTVTLSNDSSVLSLGSLQRDEAATYTCTAKNPGKAVSTVTTIQTQLNVRYGPDSASINKISPLIVTEGDRNVKVQCSSDCYPGCLYKWTNKTSSRIITSDSILSIDNVERENAGAYRCLVTNSATSEYSKSAETNITVIVQYAPDVSISLSKTTIKEGENLTLYCNGHGIPTKYFYTNLEQSWDNVVIPNNNTAVSGTEKWSSLYFKSLRLDDTGTYACTLNNGILNRSGILSQSGSKDLTVQVAPKVLKKDLRFTGSTGVDISINIPVYIYPKHDTIALIRYDGQPISRDRLTVSDDTIDTEFYGKPVALQGSMISLVLNNAKEEDFGNYSLTMTNSLGRTQVFVYVIAEGPPLAPKLFQFISETNMIHFVWQKDFNGGLHQYFIIQTSIIGTEVWTNLFNVSETSNTHKVNSTFYSANITGLSPGKYTARIFAFNVKGKSDVVDLEASFDIYSKTDDPEGVPAGIIAGVISTVVVVILVGVVVLIIVKKRRTNKDGSKTKLDSRKNTDEIDDEEDEVNTVNPMYVSADEVTDNTYAQPNKKKKTPDVSDVYAMVDKKKKKDPKEGDIYENAPPPSTKRDVKKVKKGKAKAYDESPYENPLVNEVKQPRNVNKDGLIYADLTFNDQPKGQKKLVIHGLDNMTEYVQVDFTRRADPLPDSDEEENTANK